MKLKARLVLNDLSVKKCSQLSEIPYSTLLDLVNEKKRIEKCEAGMICKLAKVLNVSVESLVDENSNVEKRLSFELFKSGMCHKVKELGDADFVIETLKNRDVDRYWAKQWYPEAYYTLAMIDYISRCNNYPLCTNYENIRKTSLKKTIFPRDIVLTAKISPELDVRRQSIKESIPEFIRFNIVEKGVRDVC